MIDSYGRNINYLRISVTNLINNKPKEHNLEDGEYTNRNMIAIGG